MALLCSIAAKALVSPVETSVRALLDEYGLDSGNELLGSLAALAANLQSFNISCAPPIGFGGLDEARVLAVVSADSLDSILRVIGDGERADTEFKASMILDVRRFRAEPGGQLDSYRHEGVTRAVMKTIAAFANSGGGTLYVGVEDDSSICGLAEDFSLANSQRGDFDGWDQCLRGLIESRFYDGRAVANYVKAAPFTVDQKTFVRMQIGNRGALTFLKRAGGGAELYVRSGTRSVPIEFHEIERHYAMRRQF